MKKMLLIALAAVPIFFASCSLDTEIYNDHLIAMWAQTLEPYSTDIAFYGDSRVAGANWKEAYPDSDVVNLGIGGDVVEGTIQRLPLLQALDVKYCFLAIGCNNCGKSSFSATTFKNHYDQLLGGLAELGITVYVNTIAGVTTANSSVDAATIEMMNANMVVANAIIKDLAESHGMALIDIAAGMNNPDGTLKADYSVDGIHFSAAGTQFWYDSLRPYVEAAL